ncbi:hypothetical protein AHMF7616_00393 [Adhaeribacter pallidiroseus]|uniref:Uncharacterized protein n=1 Tax=Adhaeribacter pallidiroseus TaxID=2072847 RepID=A0A369QAS9_9BACT|nr:hypothetical protein AHMF7616_00393 [Adhaeribacter pallidiroseus]
MQLYLLRAFSCLQAQVLSSLLYNSFAFWPAGLVTPPLTAPPLKTGEEM